MDDSAQRVDIERLEYQHDGFCTLGGEPFTGTACEAWPDGTPRAEEDYLWGTRSGKSREWNRAGRLVEEVSLNDGVRHGVSRGWYDGGRLRWEQVCEHGIALTSVEWDEAGVEVARATLDPNGPDARRLQQLRADEATRAARRGVPARLVWREVRFDYGQPVGPSAPLGRFVLELARDGHVHLTHLGAGRRDWRARLTPGAWPLISAALEHTGFPRRPEVPKVLPPDTSTFTVSACSTHAERFSVQLPTGVVFDGYPALTGLMMAAIAQTSDEGLDFGVPAAPRLIALPGGDEGPGDASR